MPDHPPVQSEPKLSRADSPHGEESPRQPVNAWHFEGDDEHRYNRRKQPRLVTMHDI